MEPQENHLVNQIDELINELYGKMIDRGVPKDTAWAEVESAVSMIVSTSKRMEELDDQRQ